MLKRVQIAWTFLLLPLAAMGQVDKIKEASKQASESSRYSGSTSGSSSLLGRTLDILFYVPRREYREVQAADDPGVFVPKSPLNFSIEAIAQAGLKTESGYMFWPRVWANAGIFSTDFRVNYMVDKKDNGGQSTLRTNDWQILHLNVIRSSLVTLRVGGGIMYEMFGSQNQYAELTLGLGIHAPDQTKVFYLEYRSAQKDDWTARTELSAFYQFQFFHAGLLHGYLGLGMTYQQYYGTINVFAVQAGLAFRIFKDRQE